MKDKVLEIAAKVLEFPVEKINENLTPNDVENWDSMRHMELLMAVEEAFGLSFTDSDMISVGSINDILSLLARRTNS